MSASLSLERIGAGFRDPVLDSQAVFRSCLAAIAAPGSLQRVSAEVDLPNGVTAAAGALLLALLDPDTRLWLSPSLQAGDAPAYLRFHTGCALAGHSAECDFALVASLAELPDLAQFPAGTDLYPDRSASVVLQVDGLAVDGGWSLSGPGMQRSARLRVAGLGADFAAAWRENNARFPRGIDFYFASGSTLCALARTTRIES
jgi:alpha-D-ribose 1-methylphosphonate 5-triphosphate synthase subunit PhnH